MTPPPPKIAPGRLVIFSWTPAIIKDGKKSDYLAKHASGYNLEKMNKLPSSDLITRFHEITL